MRQRRNTPSARKDKKKGNARLGKGEAKATEGRGWL